MVHLAKIAIQVHTDNGLGAWGDGGFGQFRVDAPTLGQDVDKDGCAPEVNDGATVAIQLVSAIVTSSPGPLPSCSHAHVQRTGATRRGDRVLDPQVSLEGNLEALNVCATTLAHGGSLIFSASMLALLDMAAAIKSGAALDPVKSNRKVLSPDFSRGFVGGGVLICESACPAVQDRFV
jgi:hypothetical protein